MRKTICLIGCSKNKADLKARKYCTSKGTPEEMYTGQLFKKRVAYAKRRGFTWAVLSAQYGLFLPDRSMPLYDLTLEKMNPADRALWHTHTAYDIYNHWLYEPFDENEADEPYTPGDLTVEIHAGKNYARPLADILRLNGTHVVLPCEGMGIGEQLKYYCENT